MCKDSTKSRGSTARRSSDDVESAVDVVSNDELEESVMDGDRKKDGC